MKHLRALGLAQGRSVTQACTNASLPWRFRLQHTRTTTDDSQARRPIEEETLSRYNKKRYYPVKIGAVFHDRYTILAKLGYGAYSTVWLARDVSTNRYASLKVCVQNDSPTSPILNDVNMMHHLKQRAEEEDHPGLDFTRLATDILEITGPTGSHYCIASKPQGCSVRFLQENFPNGKLPKLLVRSLMHRLLFSANWLHASCGTIHTDIGATNILNEIEGHHIFELTEKQESDNRSTPVKTARGLIYRSTHSAKLDLSGVPILTDFGQMRSGPTQTGWWMQDMYRAPEVLLELPWSYAVDIFAIGVLFLELLEGRNLFDPIDRVNKQYVLPLALAQYIGYLGLPPLEILKESPLMAEYFDEQGNWACASELPIPETSLEDFVTTISPGKEKDLFMKFIRKALTWDQEARATANELIEDEWLMTRDEDLEKDIYGF